jgi:hypothetical protein
MRCVQEGMKTRHPAREDSLTFAMVELDRLERERRDIEEQRRRLRATTERQANEIRELDRALRNAWPRVIARQRRRANIEHQRSCEHRRRLNDEMAREHAERMAALTRENAERRAALVRLEREVIAEFHPARAALAWLTPFAAAGLVAAFAFGMLHRDSPDPAELAPEPTPLAAVAEPSTEPVEDAPVVVSDAVDPVIDTEPIDAEPSTPEPSKPSKKPSSSKPTKKPTPTTKPLIKPNSKPIVLGDGEDPLGKL